MNKQETYKNYGIGFIAAFVLMAMIRVILMAQDGGLKSHASMGSDGTTYCINQDNPNEACVQPGGGAGSGTSGSGEVVRYIITGIRR